MVFVFLIVANPLFSCPSMSCSIVRTYDLRVECSFLLFEGDFMNKKASMMTLLIVALVSLGLMAFVSLNSETGDAIGSVKMPKISAP